MPRPGATVENIRPRPVRDRRRSVDIHGMPIPATARLIAGATAAILCLGSPVVASAAAASHHKTHHPAKKAKRLTVAVARSTAIASAAPLILDPADVVAVTACTKLSNASYTCGLRLQAASSTSVCRWTVVVSMTARGPDVSNYSHVDCAG
jgi:hypothetical protein